MCCYSIFLLLLLSAFGANGYRHVKNQPLEMAQEHDDASNPLSTDSKVSTFDQGRCLLCKVLVRRGLDKLRETGNITMVMDAFEKVCIYLRLETPQVCKGGVEIFGEQVVTVLKEAPLSPEDVCHLSFPDQCSQLTMTSLASREWRIELPSAQHAKHACRHIGPSSDASASRLEKPLKVLHISDIHVDLLYRPGSKAGCDKPVCCRSGGPSGGKSGTGAWSGKAYSIIKKFIPSHGPQRRPERGAGEWGDYRRCDLPLWTLEHMLETIANASREDSRGNSDQAALPEHVDYILLTGDLTSHDIWAQTKNGQLSTLWNVTETIRRYFPNTKIFPSAGNHDSYPPNNYPPAELESLKEISDSWIYEALGEQWKFWLPDEAIETVKIGAYYTVLVQPGLRIVSLNTNFCYNENWWIYLNPEDPGGMLKWFVEVLAKAETANEKVHVIGHVPPGRSPDCLDRWNENYYRILERFKCTIVAQFFGHTHFDEIQLFYGEKAPKVPIAVAYLAPSVTPYVDMNPAFRVYDVDGPGQESTWSVLNHRTFSLDLEEANWLGMPVWKLEYDALAAYNLKSLTPRNWDSLLFTWKEYFEGAQRDSPPASLLEYVSFYSRRRFKREKRNLTEQIAEPRNPNSPCESLECAPRVICDIVKNDRWKLCFP